MLHFETIEPKTLGLLKDLQSLPLFENTRLVGGTALALQIGHRKSIDIDLFGKIEDLPEELKSECSALGNLQVSTFSRNFKMFWLDGVKVDTVNCGYEWIDECLLIDGIRLASKSDIAAMKISAIINRGTKKDFIDLYYLLKEFSLAHILKLYMQKYPEGSEFIAIKSLTYFDDAEPDPMPYMFDTVSWEEIKHSIKTVVANFK